MLSFRALCVAAVLCAVAFESTTAQTVANASKTALVGVANVTALSARGEVRYGYQSLPQALALNLTATAPGKAINLGFVEFRLELNSTAWQVFQLSLTSVSACEVSRIAVLNATTGAFEVVPGSTAPARVYSYSVAMPDLWNTSAEVWIAPVARLPDGRSPRLNVSIGTYQQTERDVCSFNTLATAMVDTPVEPFLPFSSNVSFVKSSTNCWYGAPNPTAPFGCNAPCYPGFSPTSTCQFQQTTVTPPPPTTTVVPPNSTAAVPSGNMTTTFAPNSSTAPTTTAAPGNTTPTTTSPGGTTSAPAPGGIVWVISLVVAGDPTAFDRESFATLVARLLNIVADRIVVLSVAAGNRRQTSTTALRFYIAEAATGSSQQQLTQTFLDSVVNNTDFTSAYTVVGTPTSSQEYVTTSPQTTTAAGGGDDGEEDGLTGTQVVIIVIIVLLSVGVVIGGIVFYVRNSKKAANGAGGRSQQYGTEMDHVSPSRNN